MAAVMRKGALLSLLALIGSALALDHCEGETTADEVAAGVNLTGKMAIVTGGDSDLGYPVVRALARQGARVIVASHNLSKCEAAAKRAIKETGGIVHAMALDLTLLSSVRAFVDDYQTKFGDRLHILVNNAGIAGNPPHLSKDGYQLLFQVNYLSPFLLTELLLPALRRGGSEGRGAARVVNVASSEHAIACEAAGWTEGCLSDFRYVPPPLLPDVNVTIHYPDGAEVRPIELYGFTKVLFIKHAAELARREVAAGVQAYSLTPGWVNTTLTRGIPLNSTVARRKCEAQAPNPCPFTPDEGAAITTFCAVQATRGTGYMSRIKNCHADTVVNHGFTDAMGPELYRLSLRWAGVHDARDSEGSAVFV